MNELQIVSLEDTNIVDWNFEQLKTQLAEQLDYYKNLVYTEENIKSAKNDRSTLNKAKKVVEDARKKYKAECLKPYEAMEPKAKELVEMIEAQRTLIDETVRSFEKKQKLEKEEKVKEYYKKKSFVLGDLADRLYEGLKDSKWFNASTNKAKYEEGVQLAINKALSDVNEIKALNSPFVDTLIDVYVSTHSIDNVKAKEKELSEAHSKAQFNDTPSEVKNDVQLDGIKEIKTVNTDGETLIKVKATSSEIAQITDFMKAIGVKYEIL
jgi:hypothetical protein